ncbi:hypothetical protein Pfo_024492 [Paulownia fortunei]|nr:hypothetical protein Pfo_024492 [Paulownia fortunei]
MTFLYTKQCRSSMQSPLSIRSLASSTAPKFAASAATGAMHQPGSHGGRFKSMAATFGSMWVVIGLLGGMLSIAGCIGIHTAKQQLLHSPSVQVTKKRRECVPEVDSPDAVIRSADKFANKSFLRKVARIQKNKHAHNDPTRPDPFTRSREVETLRSVGIRN